MSWVDDFLAMEPDARLEEITIVSDLLRELRRETVKVNNATEKILDSTQLFIPDWRATLQSDMDTGDNMTSASGLRDYAEALYDHFVTEGGGI